MKKHRVVLCLLAVAVLPALGHAEIAKQEWIDRMRTVIPGLFCAKGEYFRECFKATQEECEEVALSTTRICLKDLEPKFPKKFTEETGREWGRKLGGCVGTAFEMRLKDQFKNTKKCNDPNAW